MATPDPQDDRADAADRRATHHDNEDPSGLYAMELRAGLRVAGYELIDLIDSGGMGEVWRARDAQLGRVVACKFMLHSSTAARARFSREARILAAVDHPHIAKVYAVCEEPPLIAMQLIEGEPLDRYRGDRILALRDAARAVHAAHLRGVLHRDIKPSNILVEPDGQTYVVDFGLARAPEGATGEMPLTLSDEILGTPPFMSPEQARGDHERIGSSSDVYGLGATLYTLIAGHPPFDGATSWDILQAVVEDEPAPLHGDHDLCTIAMKAMSKDRPQRYPSAAAFADDLDRWLQRRPIRARRPSLGYRLRRSVARRPTIWALVAALVLAVLGGAAFGLSQLFAAAGNLEKALQAESEALEQQARQARLAELQAFTERTRRQLAEIDDVLSRRLDDRQLEDVHERIAELRVAIAEQASRYPEEGVLDYLSGMAAFLRHDEAGAIEAFDRAIDKASAPLSTRLELPALAGLARARARIASNYHGLMAQLFVFSDDSGYHSSSAERRAIEEDLRRDGGPEVAFDREVLSLWARYVDAAAGDVQRYYQIYDDVGELLERGGRGSEDLYLLRGVLTPPPRPNEQAVAAYSAALDRYRSQPRALLLRALELVWLAREDEALADLDEALRLMPYYPEALVLRGRLHLQRGELEEAERDLSRAVAVAEHQPVSWLQRSRLRVRQRRWAHAVQDMQRAIAADAAHEHYGEAGRPRRQLADLHRELGRYERALQLYRQAQAEADNGSERLAAVRAQVDVLLLDQRADAALGLIERELDRFDGRQRIALLRMRPHCMHLAGQTEQAFADLALYLEEHPYDHLVLIERALLHRAEGAHAAALRDLERAHEIVTQLTETESGAVSSFAAGRVAVLLELGETLLDLGRVQQASARIASARASAEGESALHAVLLAARAAWEGAEPQRSKDLREEAAVLLRRQGYRLLARGELEALEHRMQYFEADAHVVEELRQRIGFLRRDAQRELDALADRQR